jgi:hypothetical protein
MDGCDLPQGEPVGEAPGQPLPLGRIIAVSACQAVALLERPQRTAVPDGDLPLEMGTLVKIRTRVSIAYGMVTGLRVTLPSLEPSDKDLKLVELDLVGEIREAGASAAFSVGSRHIPRSLSPIYLASAGDLAQV